MECMEKQLNPNEISNNQNILVNNSKLPWMPNDPKLVVRLHLFTYLMQVKIF